MVSAVRRRQQQLIANARREKTLKQQAYRDQVAQCTSKVHRTTGLLQYTVEVMKEADQTAFLQVRFPPRSGRLLTDISPWNIPPGYHYFKKLANGINSGLGLG